VLVFIENLNHYDYLHCMYRNIFKSLLIVPFFVIQFVNCLLANTNNIQSLEEIVYEAKCTEDQKFEIAELVRRNSVFYEKFSDEPLCGIIRNHGRVYKGKREGKWTKYFPNGQLKAKTFFEKNNKSGAYEEFNKFGNSLVTGFFNNNVKEGQWHFYHEDGSKCTNINYVSGEPNGAVENFFQDGKLSLRGEYLNGEEIGIWEIYHDAPPHYLCAKGRIQELASCHFNDKGEPIDATSDELTQLTELAKLKRLMLINSCAVGSKIPKVFQN